MLDAKERRFLRGKALEVRRRILEMVCRAQSGHVGGSLGAADLVVALKYHLMKHDPARPDRAERDRFILANPCALPD